MLQVDGLDEVWTKKWGEHDSIDAQKTVQKIHGRMEKAGRNYDTSGLGMGREGKSWNYADFTRDQNYVENAEPQFIRNFGFEGFRNRLVDHFHYLWTNRRIAWPTRFGSAPVDA